MKRQAKHPAKPDKKPLPFERPGLVRALNVVLYVINFFLVAYVWGRSTPQAGGVLRLALCWFIAYGLTFVMVKATRVTTRALLTMALGILLGVVLFMPQ